MLSLDRVVSSIRGPRDDFTVGGPALTPQEWEPGGRDVGARRPDGGFFPVILVYGVRAGGRPRNVPEPALELLRQIRVDTQ